MTSYAELKRSEKRALETPFQMSKGYVLDFSNRTIEEFAEDEFDLEFYHEKYAINGESKAKRLRTIWDVEDTKFIVQILRRLWAYRTTLPDLYKMPSPDEEEEVREAFFRVVNKLEGASPSSSMDAFQKFDDSETLENLINAIERDIRADQPAAALDRLHTYCQRKFRVLLETAGRRVEKSEPLHSRVGAYAKILENDRHISEMALRIIKNSISIFESFNTVRNDDSFAHDNELLDRREARFIFDSIGAILRFLKSIEPENFE